MKKGILVVSFGTTYQKTRENNIDKIAETVRMAYPDCEIRQAYSSSQVRNILRKRDRIIVPDTKEALEQMRESGICHVRILPTHIIDGIENNIMKQTAEEYRHCFKTMSIAQALLEKDEDYEITAKALWDSLKETINNRIVIFMGHGSKHSADSSYEKLEQALRKYSGCELYIATVEGSITIEDVIDRMNKKNKNREKGQVVLIPFMLVAGDHAVNDMAGEKDSFYSKLKDEGYETECILKGIGEYEKIREVYMQHLQNTNGE